MEIIFITGNKHKLEESKLILKDHTVINELIDLPELQGSSEEIAREKAKLAFGKIGKPCFVEDTSLCFEAWNGLPGPYIKEFVERVGVKKIPSLLAGKDKSASAISTIGFAKSENQIYCFQGIVKGKIVSDTGKDAFAWDSIFIPDKYKLRFSEMDLKEKNEISHRRIALESFNDFLKELNIMEKIY